MASIFDTIWEGVKALAKNGLIGVNNPLPTGTAQKLQAIKDPSDLFYFITTEALLPKEVVDHFISVTTYANVEKSGLDPRTWFASLPEIEKGKIRYGPDDYNTAVKFFGNWGNVQKVMYLIAVLSAIAIVALGIGPATRSAIEATKMMRAGVAIEEIYNFLKVKNMLTLPRLLIPGITAGVAWLGGQLAQTQLTATGDLLTYMKKGVADSEAALEKMKGQGAGSGGGGYAPQADVAKTRVTTNKASKPVVIYGTLFSSVVKRTDVFERQIDDEITSKEDLRMDAQANLQRWLQTLPSRLIYTIDVRQNPYDEMGVRQTGTWLTMTLLIRHISGATQPIDTIMLGPVNPVVYVPRSADIESVQYELPGLLSAKEIAEVVMGNQTLRVADDKGNIAPVTFGGTESQAPQIPSAPTSVPAPAATPPTRSFVRFVGSPDVFFRADGRYLPEAEARAKGVNLVTDVEDIPTPRPEVKTGSDFALWSGKALSIASVPGVGFVTGTAAATPPPPTAPVLTPQTTSSGVPYQIYETTMNGRTEFSINPATNTPYGFSVSSVARVREEAQRRLRYYLGVRAAGYDAANNIGHATEYAYAARYVGWNPDTLTNDQITVLTGVPQSELTKVGMSSGMVFGLVTPNNLLGIYSSQEAANAAAKQP